MDLTFRISLLAAGVLAATGAGCDREKRSPNVVFILADDLGYFQTGCYGSNYYITASIDRLAAEGIRFTDAYAACSVSSPTRASIMTGKYPARLHLTDFIPGNQNDNYPLSQPEWHKYLPLEEVTLAEAFSGKGYRTAIFGKWHLSKEKFGPESIPFNPDKQGFDQHFVSDKPAYELYDLENDISESVDLAEREKEITLKLADDLRKWREEVGSQMPVRNKNALSDIFGFRNQHYKQRLSFTYLRD